MRGWAASLLAVAALSCGDVSRVRTWSCAEQGRWLSDVWGSAPDDVYAVGYDGTILHSRDRGATWSSTVAPPVGRYSVSPWLTAVRGSDRLDVRAVGSDGAILHSTDGGAAWVTEKTDTDVRFFGLWFRDRNEVYVAGEKGTVLHTEDGGATWAKQDTPTSMTLWDVWGSGPEDVYIVGGDTHVFADEPPSGGVILHSTDHGRTWTSIEPPGSDRSFSAVWGSGPENVFVGGNGGTFLRSRDRGKTWTKVSLGVTLGIGSIWGIGPDVYVGGGLSGIGTLLHSTDGGDSFSVILDQSIGMSGLWGDANGETVYAVGTGGILIGRSGD